MVVNSIQTNVMVKSRTWYNQSKNTLLILQPLE